MSGSQTITMMATLLGAGGMWLMLPRPSMRGRIVGMAFAATALGLLMSQVPRLGNWIAEGIFFVLAAVTVVAAAATVTLRNPVYSAIWFGLSLLGTAGLFLFQGAQFLAVATVVVYAGAILVTFLFVLMLANPTGQAPYDRISWEALISATSGAVIIGVLSMCFASVLGAPDGPVPAVAVTEADGQGDRTAGGHMAQLGTELFGRHLIAVEVAGTLLLVALVGAAVIVAQGKEPIGTTDSPRGSHSQ